MFVRRAASLTLSLLVLAGATMLLLAGCGKKEEPTAPGYYTGPMVKKGAAPAAGGQGGRPQPGADIN